MTIAKGPALEITRIFDAPPSRVFDAWLTREEWEAWIGPEGVNCEVPMLEPDVGGRYRLIMHLPAGRTLKVTGVFTAVERAKTLAFTWGAEGDPRETLVTLTFTDLNGRTELKLRQEGLPTATDRDSHGAGWNSALDKLSRYLSSTKKDHA